jgi:NADH dehydrogenase
MRVLVLGAGYAGVVLARTLEDTLPDGVDLVVVDESPDHLVQHELHMLVRHPELADDLAIPLTDLLDRATIRTATVTDVDRTERTVHLAAGDRLTYDVAAICLGARTDFHGMSDVAEHAIPLKRIAHAEAIRADALAALERDSPRFVVGGAGLAGIQLAGELSAFARETEVSADVVLLEQASRVAPAFDERFGRALHDELVQRGVDVRTDQTVTGATADAVELATGESVQYDVLAWTGGIRGTRAVHGDRPSVRASLALDDRTFVLGDAARVVDAEGRLVPASAQSAVRMARVVAENVTRVVADNRGGFSPRFERFYFDPPGWLVSVGDGAVAQVGSSVLRGSAARALKTGVGARYLASTGGLEEALSLVSAEYLPRASTSGRREP